MKELLEKRKAQKAKKPTFVRHAAHRKPSLQDGKWRKPKGLHNKLRDNRKSRGTPISDGWRSPVAVRYLSRSGKNQVVVKTLAQIKDAKPKTDALIIGAVGNKRRLELLEEATKAGFEIQNHDAPKRIAKIKETLATRGKKRNARVSKRDAQAKSAAAAKEKKVAKADAKASEQSQADGTSDKDSKEAKAAVKKEQDKILTQKDQ